MVEIRETGPAPTTIRRDARDQRPWTFTTVSVETRDATLSTGDYAIPAGCTHDPGANTYQPQLAIERKSRQDFLTALAWERERFISEYGGPPSGHIYV